MKMITCNNCKQRFDRKLLLKSSKTEYIKERDIRSQGQDYGETIRSVVHNFAFCPFCRSDNTNYFDVIAEEAKKAEEKEKAQKEKVAQISVGKNNLHKVLSHKDWSNAEYVVDGMNLVEPDYSKVKITVNGKPFIGADLLHLFAKGATINIVVDDLDNKRKAVVGRRNRVNLIYDMFISSSAYRTPEEGYSLREPYLSWSKLPAPVIQEEYLKLISGEITCEEAKEFFRNYK